MANPSSPSEGLQVVSTEHGSNARWGDKILITTSDPDGFGVKGRVLLKCGNNNRELEQVEWAPQAISVRLPTSPWCSGPYEVGVATGNRMMRTRLALPSTDSIAASGTPISPVTDSTVLIPQMLPPVGGKAGKKAGRPGAPEMCLRRKRICKTIPGKEVCVEVPGVEVCQCRLRLILTKVEYTGDDVGSDWKYTLREGADVWNPFATGHSTGEHQLSPGTAEFPGTVLFEQTFPLCPAVYSTDIAIQATEEDGFFDNTGTAMTRLTTDSLTGSQDFTIEVPVSEWYYGTARIRFTIQAEWKKVNCTSTPAQKVCTKLPDVEECVDYWVAEPCGPSSKLPKLLPGVRKSAPQSE